MTTIIQQIWHKLNEPVGLLICGSFFSWVFLNLIWEPYKKNKAAKDRQEKIRQEIHLRLIQIETYFRNKYFGTGIIDLLDGQSSMIPEFKGWRIGTLIVVGWSESDLIENQPNLETLQAFCYEKNRSQGDITEIALNTITTLKKNLRF